MGQVLVRNVSDRALATFKMRAKAKGTSLEQEVRELIESTADLTAAEKLVLVREMQARTKPGFPPLTKDEIREGLE